MDVEISDSKSKPCVWDLICCEFPLDPPKRGVPVPPQWLRSVTFGCGLTFSDFASCKCAHHGEACSRRLFECLMLRPLSVRDRGSGGASLCHKLFLEDCFMAASQLGLWWWRDGRYLTRPRAFAATYEAQRPRIKVRSWFLKNETLSSSIL